MPPAVADTTTLRRSGDVQRRTLLSSLAVAVGGCGCHQVAVAVEGERGCERQLGLSGCAQVLVRRPAGGEGLRPVRRDVVADLYTGRKNSYQLSSDADTQGTRRANRTSNLRSCHDPF